VPSTHPVSTPLLLRRYAAGPRVGSGATSEVRMGYDTVRRETVALKSVPLDDGMADRARGEIRAASRLAHPGVVPLLDWGEEHGTLVLVYELVDGPSLADLDRPADAEAVRLGGDLLEALAHAHRRGVVHRDVKPANVLIDGGRARLTDFGAARVAGGPSLTAVGDLIGTLAYMAPEQARGERAGPPADVWAACLILYEALSGENPIAARRPLESARRAAEGIVPALASRRPDLHPRICATVQDGLDPDPASRPRAQDLAHDLRALERLPVATRATRASRATAPSRRRWARHRLGIALAAAAVAAAGMMMLDPMPERAALVAGGVGLVILVAPGMGSGREPRRSARGGRSATLPGRVR
jgi:serine/threonine protein kinase